jgi:hypothetical protein
MNFEICNSVSSVKYVHKYIYKAHDRAILQAGKDIDEIKQYMEGRYISSHEAFWRVLGFETNGISHNLLRLPIHLPNLQYVKFNASGHIETILINTEIIMLTEFFKVDSEVFQTIQNGRTLQTPLTCCEFS